jgi:hypothetical protein
MATIFRKDSPLSVYRPVSKNCSNTLREYARKCGITDCYEQFYLPIKSTEGPCDWHQYRPNKETLSVSTTGLVQTEYGIGLQLKEYKFLNECTDAYSMDGTEFDSIIYLTSSINVEDINMSKVFEEKIIVRGEVHSESFPIHEETKIEEVIPEGIDPELWQFLTPAQKRLW